MPVYRRKCIRMQVLTDKSALISKNKNKMYNYLNVFNKLVYTLCVQRHNLLWQQFCLFGQKVPMLIHI